MTFFPTEITRRDQRLLAKFLKLSNYLQFGSSDQSQTKVCILLWSNASRVPLLILSHKDRKILIGKELSDVTF